MSDPIAQQMGSDLAQRLMTRLAFEILFTLSDDPDKERAQIARRLLRQAEQVRLPPMPASMAPEVREAMKREIESTFSNEAVSVN